MSFFRKKKDKKPTDLPIKSSTSNLGNIKRSQSLRSTPSPITQNGDIIGATTLGLQEGSIKLVIDCEEYDPGDLGTSSVSSQASATSCLNKNIQEVLQNKDALSCFIQYMDSRKAGALIRFWCDAESFQAATWSRIRTHTLNVTRQNTLSERSKQSSEAGATSPQEQEQINYPKAVLTNTDNQYEGSVSNSDIKCDVRTDTDQIEAIRTEQRLTTLSLDTNSHLSSPKSVISPTSTKENSRVTSHLPDSLTNNIDKSRESSIVPTISYSKERSPSSVDVTEKLKRSIEKDAVLIFQKYLSQDATHPVGITDSLRNECIRKICQEDGEVDPNCFHECQNFIVNKMDSEYFTEFVSSEFYYRHQVNILTGSAGITICLRDVLYNEGSLFYFMEYIEQEGASDLLQFWLAVDNFRKHLVSAGSDYDGIQAQNDAMVIYDKYFSLQASHPLGFDDRVRFEVEGNICREEGPLPDCFQKPFSIVLKTLEKMYFPSFLQSEIYYKYLSELVSTVQIASDLPKQSKHRRQDSDASSVHSSHSAGSESVSHKNTLLAMDTSHLRKSIPRLHESDINIDPGLLNPDLLWKRTDSSLSLGKVDSLGRFMSEFDPHPDLEKAKGSGLFKKNKKKEKEQEDMAVQIAQKIISDVTSVTQAIGALQDLKPSMEQPEPNS